MTFGVSLGSLSRCSCLLGTACCSSVSRRFIFVFSGLLLFMLDRELLLIGNDEIPEYIFHDPDSVFDLGYSLGLSLELDEDVVAFLDFVYFVGKSPLTPIIL